MWYPFKKTEPAVSTGASKRYWETRALTSGRVLAETRAELTAAHAALRAVVALETPACASIGKRIAAKAREGLPAAQARELAEVA